MEQTICPSHYYGLACAIPWPHVGDHSDVAPDDDESPDNAIHWSEAESNDSAIAEARTLATVLWSDSREHA